MQTVFGVTWVLIDLPQRDMTPHHYKTGICQCLFYKQLIRLNSIQNTVSWIIVFSNMMVGLPSMPLRLLSLIVSEPLWHLSVLLLIGIFA